ncbi:DUF2516 family protein [Arsenicicoccus dermatophilus]|uniref:DUF2516 family protein n=1 Tax=Arsenicicoccus dermatophilus TaxID=1076331 RepID=UPI00391743A5
MLADLSFTLQGLITSALMLAAVVGALVGLGQVLRTREDAFRAAGKLTKAGWGAILGGSALVVFAFGPLSLLGLVAVVAIIVYWVDVRPALRAVLGAGRSDGPYGPW